MVDEDEARAISERVVDVLNRALKADPDAINDLFAHRAKCNEALEKEDVVYVREGLTVGVLGIINGILGARPDGWGKITSLYESERSDAQIVRFGLTADWRDKETE